MFDVSHEVVALAATALLVGVAHTLLGPDHYLPFVMMGRAGRWRRAKTIKITVACGIGHVAGSVGLGVVGIGLGVAAGRLEALQSVRGELAVWGLIGFGLVYTAWGLRQARRQRPHSHAHAHADGIVHTHPHAHVQEHAHVHPLDGDETPAPRILARLTPWVLFTIFVFGPCEPLIPLMMYPAMVHGAAIVVLVVVLYGVATVATMVGAVLACEAGMERLPGGGFERYAHAAAGIMLLACGLAIRFLGL